MVHIHTLFSIYVCIFPYSQHDAVDYVSLLESDSTIRRVYQPILNLMDKALNRNREKSAAELRIMHMRAHL